MSVVAKPLINAKYGSNAGVSEYTVPANTRAIIDKFTATNTDTAVTTLSVNIIPNGQSSGNSNAIVIAKSIAAGATADITELQNQILAAGDSIFVLAGTASKLTIRASGREVA